MTARSKQGRRTKAPPDALLTTRATAGAVGASVRRQVRPRPRSVVEWPSELSGAGASWLWEAACQWVEPEHDAHFGAWADATLAAM